MRSPSHDTPHHETPPAVGGAFIACRRIETAANLTAANAVRRPSALKRPGVRDPWRWYAVLDWKKPRDVGPKESRPVKPFIDAGDPPRSTSDQIRHRMTLDASGKFARDF